MLDDLSRDPYRQSWAPEEKEAKLKKMIGPEDWKLFSDIIQAIGEIVAVLSRDVQRILPLPVCVPLYFQSEIP